MVAESKEGRQAQAATVCSSACGMRMLGTARSLMNERVRRPRGGADIVATWHTSVKRGERSRAGSTFMFARRRVVGIVVSRVSWWCVVIDFRFGRLRLDMSLLMDVRYTPGVCALLYKCIAVRMTAGDGTAPALMGWLGGH